MSIWEGCVFLIGRICGALCGVCALYALCSGSTAAFSAALLDGIARAVQLAITLGGAMCFWGGILEAAQRAGVLKLLCRVFRPLFSFLFPKCRKNPRASEALCASFCANLIGLGNAATPLGIAAMRAMAAPEARGWASDDMILFAVLNTTAFSLLPTNLLSLRREVRFELRGLPRRRLRRPVFDFCPGLALLGDWLHLCRFPVPPACPPFPQPGKTASCTQRKSCGARKEALRHAGRI